MYSAAAEMAAMSEGAGEPLLEEGEDDDDDDDDERTTPEEDELLLGVELERALDEELRAGGPLGGLPPPPGSFQSPPRFTRAPHPRAIVVVAVSTATLVRMVILLEPPRTGDVPSPRT